jgi:hypothetical protein
METDPYHPEGERHGIQPGIAEPDEGEEEEKEEEILI